MSIFKPYLLKSKQNHFPLLFSPLLISPYLFSSLLFSYIIFSSLPNPLGDPSVNSLQCVNVFLIQQWGKTRCSTPIVFSQALSGRGWSMPSINRLCFCWNKPVSFPFGKDILLIHIQLLVYQNTQILCCKTVIYATSTAASNYSSTDRGLCICLWWTSWDFHQSISPGCWYPPR